MSKGKFRSCPGNNCIVQDEQVKADVCSVWIMQFAAFMGISSLAEGRGCRKGEVLEGRRGD